MKRSFALFLIAIIPVVINAQEVIENPERPLSNNSGRILQLKEEMRITDEQGGFYFKNPHNIKVAFDGSIFILDEEQFLKFNPKGQFLKNLFKKGQGPGEFQRIGNYLFEDNKIIVSQSRPNKIVRMDLGGNLIEELKPEKAVSRLIACFNDKYVMAKSSFPKLKKKGEEPEIIDIHWNLLFVSHDGKIEEAGQYFQTQWFAKRVQAGIIANYIVDFSAIPFKKNYLVISHTQDYLIKLFNLETNQITKTFKRKYKRVKYRSGKAGLKEVRAHTYTLEPPRDYYNDIQKLLAYKDYLWVLTSTRDKEKAILIDVFDGDGRYTDNFFLPLFEKVKLDRQGSLPITVFEDSLFVVERDENDIPAVVKYRIMN